MYQAADHEREAIGGEESEVDEARQRPGMPRSAQVAIILLGGSLAVGVVRILIGPLPVDPSLPRWFTPVVSGITVLVLGLLLSAIATGRRWAFNASIIIFALGLPASVSFGREQLNTGLGGFLVLAAQVLAQAIAFGLLFARPSREWFAACRKARAA